MDASLSLSVCDLVVLVSPRAGVWLSASQRVRCESGELNDSPESQKLAVSESVSVELADQLDEH